MDEHAVARIGSSGRALRAARIAAALMFFLDGVTFAAWVTRIPAIQERLELRNAVLGVALLMMSIGAIVAMPIAGRIVARAGSRSATAIAVALFGAGLLLPGFATGVVTLSLALLLFGAGFGAVNVTINAQAVSVERRYGRPIMSSFHAIFSLGGIAGAALGALASAHHVPVAVHFTLTSVLVVIAALTTWRWLLDDAPPAPHATHADDAPARKPGFRPFALLGAIAFCSALGEGAMADWSAVFLRQVSLTTPATAALGFAAFSVSMTLGRFAADRLTLRLGPAQLVRLSGLLAASGVLLAMLLPTAPTAILGFACVGAGLAALMPSTFSAAGRTRGVAPSVAIAAVSSVGYLGFLTGPTVIGLASELVTLRWALVIVLAGCCVAAALARHVQGSPTTDLTAAGGRRATPRARAHAAPSCGAGFLPA